MSTAQPIAIGRAHAISNNRDQDLESRIYSSFRVIAAAQFANAIRKQNWEALQHPVEDSRIYKRNTAGKVQKTWDSGTSYIAEALKRPLCYATLINSFIYGIFALTYSQEERGHVLE